MESDQQSHADHPTAIDVQDPPLSKSLARAFSDLSELDGEGCTNVDIRVPHSKTVPIKLWVVLIATSLGVFFASVSTSALIIAFPVLLKDLKMTMDTMIWVLLVLLLMMGSFMPVAGKLGDMIGQSIIFKIGYWCFIFGSLGGGFVNEAHRGYDLIAVRVVMGFGAALLFTNSIAIITNSFAPYGKVGLSQGIFQLFSALGMVLGPLIGGAFATSDWRWIFWFNCPPGGICAILITVLIQDKAPHRPGGSEGGAPAPSLYSRLRHFDLIGAFFHIAGLTLLLVAVMQAVAPDALLSQDGPLAGLIVSGCFCSITFLVWQFFAPDPLIPPSAFASRLFSTGIACGTLINFVRNSVSYAMIFYLQGPKARDPLQAGIDLVPYGIGVMAGSFGSGGLADKLGIRPMIVGGPLVALAGLACLSVMDGDTSDAYVGGILFLTGLGLGVFQSPNGMMTMLSLPVERRGVAAAVNFLTMSVAMMIGIAITFSLVLHSMTAAQLFKVFLDGGGFGPGGDDASRSCLRALANNYYIMMACCAAAATTACTLPHDVDETVRAHATAKAADLARRDRMKRAAALLDRVLREGGELALSRWVRDGADAAHAAAGAGAEEGAAARRAACVDTTPMFEGAERLTPLADFAELPADMEGRDLRRHVEGCEADAVFGALSLLEARGWAARTLDEGRGVYSWRKGAKRRPQGSVRRTLSRALSRASSWSSNDTGGSTVDIVVVPPPHAAVVDGGKGEGKGEGEGEGKGRGAEVELIMTADHA